MKKKYVIIILFVAYLILLTKIIVFKYPIDMSLIQRYEISAWQWFASGNYVPFKTILNYIGGNPTWVVAIRNLEGNIIPFIPLGFFIPLLYNRPLTWKYILAVAFLLSIALEGMQVLLRVGVFDIDDIILNVLSAIVGYGAYRGLRKYFELNTRLQ